MLSGSIARERQALVNIGQVRKQSNVVRFETCA